jgi:hypothetical protein
MTFKMIAWCVVLSVAVTMVSCGGVATEGRTVGQSSWPSCRWPAALDPDASGSTRDHCVATRTLLSCALSGGVTEECWTNDPTRCDGGDIGAAECHAECAQDEYLARCGGVGPGPIPDPPASCHFLDASPAGIAFYCCPCGA